nr:MAG TPA: stabilization protein [Bacteriophage sp.]
MQKKYFNFQPKGMNTNMSFKFQSNEYATYMKNIRLTEDDNGIMSLQFEKGNKVLNTDVQGCVIGACVLNKYLILFTQKTEAHRRPNGEIVSYKIDSIYRLEIVDDKLTTTKLFEGNLNFDTKYPLETLGVYENENIQKVYFIDGKNQARVINILEDYDTKYWGIANYKATAFDFVPELQLNESISIKKIIGTGEFPQGTIQYVFSYYDKHGRQSNLFAQSDLQYLAYNKGVSPEEKVNCSFRINISNLDAQFDYLRIYSIIRTSQDAVPTCKRVVDIKITDTSLSYIDNGSTGDIIDNTELLYLGGNTICPNTFEQKDGTLFLGNYEIKNNDIPEEVANKIKSALFNKFDFKKTYYRLLDDKEKIDYFNYEGQLGESDVAGFKFMEWYGVAIQFQNKNGRYSSPIYLGSVQNYATPEIDDLYLRRGELVLDLIKMNSDGTLENYLKDENGEWIIDVNTWVKARLLIVNPTDNLKTILCQGIISSTVFNYKDRYDNAPFVMSSWRMNSIGQHLQPLAPNGSYLGEIQNIEKNNSPLVYLDKANKKVNITIKYGFSPFLLGYIIKVYLTENSSGENAKYIYITNSCATPTEAIQDLYNWNSSITLDAGMEISKEKSDWHEEIDKVVTGTLINTLSSDFVKDNSESFAYDESIVTFNSPDLEDQYNNINKNNILRIIGVLKSTPLFSNYLIQGTDLNDPSKGVISNKNTKDLKSALLWRDMLSTWDNLGNYDKNKDYIFAIYLWHRETSFSDNGIEKKNSDGSTRKVWSKPVKKIFSNTRTCKTMYLRDNMKYDTKNRPVPEEYKFNYYELPIDDIRVITTNKDSIYKLASNMNSYYTDTLSYSADVNKIFPTINPYYIRGDSIDTYNISHGSDNFYYSGIVSTTSQDPIRIKYKETPHAIISFGHTDFGTKRLPLLNHNMKGGGYDSYASLTDFSNKYKLFWNEQSDFYSTKYIWEDYKDKYEELIDGDIETAWGLYNEALYLNNISYFYLADLCIKDVNISPYEWYDGNKDIISQYSFIPAGKAVRLNNSDSVYTTVKLKGTHGDTYYQRWDCLKTFPYSTDDKNQYIDITSFFVESRINLDGRYDKQRGLKYNLGVLDTNFNLINKSYTQRNNFFSYRQIEDEGVNSFPNQITISKTKVLGEDIDSWTNVTLASVFDLDGDKGKLNAIRKINNDLYCFQDSGVSRLLYNSRVQVNTSDGVPIEIANSAKLQDKQYLSDSIGCQNKWAIKSTPSGIYFVDTYNGELYKLNDKGITPISQNKFKNYFTKLSTNVWSPSLWNYANPNEVIDSIKLEYDSTTYDLYIINKDTALAYNELLGEFTSFYDYGSILYWINLENKSLQIYNDGIYEAYKGDYGTFKGNRNCSAIIEFIANGDFDSDKVFETVELTTSDIAKINNWKADYYPFDTLNVSNEYQEGNNIASGTTIKKKFRTWRWQIPRNNKKNEDGIITNRDRIRNMWAKIRLSKKYNSPLSIYDINVAYYS